ncbi:MAG TPA: alkaline phosphatase family protein [Gemmatimonadota bacterium]|nr:alkaline phosphatase family protein [Gemmatimonadota bacterium]
MSRVLLIGLDSADADLVERWCEDGSLPTLAALRREGAWGRLRTTAEIMHVSAWPTIYTGATPGRHGMYHAYQIRAGEQTVHRTEAESCALPPFWKFLDDAGRKCLVMDAFMDYPLDGFGGIQILEYGTWTWFSDPAASPKKVWKEILRRFGPYPAPEHTRVLAVPEPARFRDQLVAGARVKGEITRWLLREKPWEMAFVTFGEPHGGGHYLWHVSDAEFPNHPPDGVPGAENALRDVYRAVDAAIGEILREVDDSTTVLVTSGDGMGPNYSGSHLMPEVLNRLGLLYSGGVGSDDREGASGNGKPRKSLASTLRGAIPLSLRHAVTRCLPRSLHYRLSMKWVNANIDWERSRVFCIPNANEGFFRVNVEGREPRGNVDSGAAYDDLLAELRASLSELIVPETGRVAADRIVRIDQLLPGPEQRHLPDLVVTWDFEARILAELRSERCGLVRKEAGYQTAPYYTGNHTPNAFVLARGPHVQSGAALTGGHIVDLAPTLFALLGVDPPAQFEGRAWAEILPR